MDLNISFWKKEIYVKWEEYCELCCIERVKDRRNDNCLVMEVMHYQLSLRSRNTLKGSFQKRWNQRKKGVLASTVSCLKPPSAPPRCWTSYHRVQTHVNFSMGSIMHTPHHRAKCVMRWLAPFNLHFCKHGSINWAEKKSFVMEQSRSQSMLQTKTIL